MGTVNLQGDYLLNEITKAIESLQNPMSRAEVTIAIAEQFNLIHQADTALPYIERTNSQHSCCHRQ